MPKYSGICAFKSRAPILFLELCKNTVGFVCLDRELQGFCHWRLTGFPRIVQKHSGICVFRSRASGFLPLAAVFWVLVAKWLPDGLWRLILRCSGLRWPNASEMASVSSFWAILSSGGQVAPRWSLEAHFELFWALVAKWLPDGLWRLILSCSELWWPSGSQMASGGSFWALLRSGGQMAPRRPPSTKVVELLS